MPLGLPGWNACVIHARCGELIGLLMRLMLRDMLNIWCAKNKNKGADMFLPFYRLITAIFVYYLFLEGLKKMGLVKSK